jgi:hypothetical protein
MTPDNPTPGEDVREDEVGRPGLPARDADRAPSAIPALPDIRTLNGEWDAYCHVCWEPFYTLWVSDEEPDHTCVVGAERALDCPQAMGRARLKASLEHAR